MKHMWSEEEIASLIEEQGGSESHLYKNTITIYKSKTYTARFEILTTEPIAITLNVLKTFLNDNGYSYSNNIDYAKAHLATGFVIVETNTYEVTGIIYNVPFDTLEYIDVTPNKEWHAEFEAIGNATITNHVVQVF